MVRKWKAVLGCAAGAMLVSTITVQAAQGDWLARARVVNISPDASSSALNIDINSKITPELDFSYFITRNFALELILATRKHEVTAGGAPVGSVKHLPPTLTLQYHFMPDSTAFRPYVGAGINYTNFSGVDLPGGLNVDRSSWGLAFQAGADIPLTKQWYLNVDIKKVYIRTDIKSGDTTVDTFKVDPLLVGVGVGYRF